MSTAVEKRTASGFTGWHMFACLAGFFGTIIAVNLTMAFLAAGSWTGLIVKNSYVASQNFNTELAAAKAQTATGLRSQISLSDDVITFTITAADGSAMRPDEALVWIGRPAFEQQDRLVTAECADSGTCSAPAELASGPWALRIAAVLPDRTYRRDIRITVLSNGTARVE